MQRYNNIDYVLSLPIYRAQSLIKTAQEEKRKELTYQLYLTDRPYFKETMSFNDYYERAYPSPVEYDHRGKDELMAEILQTGGEG